MGLRGQEISLFVIEEAEPPSSSLFLPFPLPSPSHLTFPFFRTMMLSALMTVSSLCAMTSVVLPAIRFSKASCTVIEDEE